MQFGCGGRSKEKRNALLAEQLSHPARAVCVPLQSLVEIAVSMIELVF
jgi:hypothetical protein